MKNALTLFLKIVIFGIAIAVLAGMIRFPQTEGRAANLDLISIYTDPFIIYMYIASIPFFIALYQGFKLLGFIGQNKTISRRSMKALQTIKYCAISIICFIAGAEIFVLLGEEADKAGFISLGIITTFASILVATIAAVFQKKIYKLI